MSQVIANKVGFVANIQKHLPTASPSGAQAQAGKLSSSATPNNVGKPSEFESKVVSKAYLFNIKQSDTTVNVTAYLPEQFSVDLSARYTTPLADAAGLSNSPTGLFLKATGNSGMFKQATVKIWDSSDGITMQLPFIFVQGEVINGVPTDINDIVLALMSLASPSDGGLAGSLKAPGPTFLNLDAVNTEISKLGASLSKFLGFSSSGENQAAEPASTDQNTSQNKESALDTAIKKIAFKNRIQVSIGEFLFFDSVVVENVSVTYDTQMVSDSTGRNPPRPMKAMVNLTFSTHMTPSIEDIQKIFLREQTNTTTATQPKPVDL